MGICDMNDDTIISSVTSDPQPQPLVTSTDATLSWFFIFICVIGKCLVRVPLVNTYYTFELL